jgi:ubiquitin C
MLINVRTYVNCFTIEILPELKISFLKAMIQDMSGIPPEKQKLIFAGKILIDDMSLSDYNIIYMSTIIVHPKECKCC